MVCLVSLRDSILRLHVFIISKFALQSINHMPTDCTLICWFSMSIFRRNEEDKLKVVKVLHNKGTLNAEQKLESIQEHFFQPILFNCPFSERESFLLLTRNKFWIFPFVVYSHILNFSSYSISEALFWKTPFYKDTNVNVFVLSFDKFFTLETIYLKNAQLDWFGNYSILYETFSLKKMSK